LRKSHVGWLRTGRRAEGGKSKETPPVVPGALRLPKTYWLL